MFSKLTLLLIVGSIVSIDAGIFGNILGAVNNVGKADFGLAKSLVSGGVINATKNVIDAKFQLVKTVEGSAINATTGALTDITNVAKGALNIAGTGNTATGSTATGSTATGSIATGSTATGSTATGSTATGSTATGSTATGNTATTNTNGTNGTNCTASPEINALHNKTQQFLISGQQKLGALAARFGSFALFWNSTKLEALLDFIRANAAFKDQADAVSAQLQTNLRDVDNKAKTASGEEKARLECDKTILKADLDSVKSANDQVLNDTRIQAPFDQVQEELKHVFDNFSTTDCPSFDNKITELLSRVKQISDEGRFYGIKRSDEIKVQLEAERQKQSDDPTQLSVFQNLYKDRILHILSFIIQVKTNVDNAIVKAQTLLETVEESKKACLISSIVKLKELSDYFEGQIEELWPRLQNL